jgi:hypothetical protein
MLTISATFDMHLQLPALIFVTLAPPRSHPHRTVYFFIVYFQVGSRTRNLLSMSFFILSRVRVLFEDRYGPVCLSALP